MTNIPQSIPLNRSVHFMQMKVFIFVKREYSVYPGRTSYAFRFAIRVAV